jgi:cytochrome c2
VALVGWWLAKRRQGPADRPRKPFTVQGWARIAAPLGVAAIVLAGAYGPYALFRVTPWPMTEVVQGGPRKMVMQVALPPETEFERTTAQETYKWCRFCHTMNQGEKALVGPNLWAIFGQRAGTSPGFAYSKAMAEARDKGLVWDDRTIAEYIRHPDVFMPGHLDDHLLGPGVGPQGARGCRQHPEAGYHGAEVEVRRLQPSPSRSL